MSAGFSTEVLIKMSMANGVSSVLNVLGKEVLGLKRDILSTQGALDALKTGFGRAVLGAGMLAAGGLMLKGVFDLTKAYDGVNEQLTRMGAAGDSVADRQRAYHRAWEMTRDVVGSVSDNLEAISQLKPQFGLENAMTMATDYRKSSFVLGALTGKNGNEQAYQLEQAVHQSGRLVSYDTKGNVIKNADGSDKIDPSAFSHGMNLFTSMVTASRGKIDARDILSFTKQARTSNLSFMTDQGFADINGMIQTIGGARAGTAVAALNNIFEKGQISKLGVHQLEHYGLVDKSKVTEGKGPNGVMIAEGGVANTALLRSSPIAWIRDIVAPAIRETLKREGKDYSDKAVDAAAKKIKVTNTGGQMFSEGTINAGVDQNESAAVMKALGVDKYNEVKATNVAANMKALHEAMGNLRLAFAENVVPVILPMIQGLTNGIANMANFFHAHPDIAKVIVGTITGIGVALSVAGAALLLSASPFLWVPAAVVAGVGVLVSGLLWLRDKIMGGNKAQADPNGHPEAHAVKAAVQQAHGATGGMGVMIHTALESLSKVAPGLTRLIRGIGHLIGPELSWLGRVLLTGAKAVGGFLFGMIKDVGNAAAILGTCTLMIADKFSGLVGSMLDGLAKFFGGITNFIQTHLPWLAGAFHALAGGGPDTHAPAQRGPDTSRLPGQKQVNITIHQPVVIDGKQVAKTVTKHVVKEMTGPASGRTGYNGAMTPNIGAGR